MYGKSVLPLDGSRFAEFSWPVAAEIARRAGSHVEAVMVHDSVTSLGFGEWVRPSRSWKEEYLEFVASELRGYTGEDASQAMPIGRIPEALEDHIETTAPDLIVMATHGRGPLSRDSRR